MNMWRVNKIGKEQVWYSSDLIEKIKKECQSVYDSNNKFYGLSQRILELIKEKENTDV